MVDDRRRGTWPLWGNGSPGESLAGCKSEQARAQTRSGKRKPTKARRRRAALIRPLLALVGGLAGAWALLLYPAVRLAGWDGGLASTAAVLLCLVPAVIVLAWDESAPPNTPTERLRRMALATGLRMGLV